MIDIEDDGCASTKNPFVADLGQADEAKRLCPRADINPIASFRDSEHAASLADAALMTDRIGVQEIASDCGGRYPVKFILQQSFEAVFVAANFSHHASPSWEAGAATSPASRPYPSAI